MLLTSRWESPRISEMLKGRTVKNVSLHIPYEYLVHSYVLVPLVLYEGKQCFRCRCRFLAALSSRRGALWDRPNGGAKAYGLVLSGTIPASADQHFFWSEFLTLLPYRTAVPTLNRKVEVCTSGTWYVPYTCTKQLSRQEATD